jgi:hypothetical protein
MLEKVGNKDVLVRNYTSNFDIKEYINQVLIPEAFPNVSTNKLNIGFTGVVSEMISQGIEDAAATAALMMNEAFITRAVLPNSIYSEASLYDLGYRFATPSVCSFALQLWIPDIVEYATKVTNTTTYRYKLDRDTKIILGDNSYKLDYDIIIDFQFIDGNRVFNIYYDIDEVNSISDITNKYVKHQVSSVNWLVLFLNLREFDRKVIETSITDNLVTTNSDITLKWNRQIAGFDLIYITPQGERLSMTKKNQYTSAEVDPFAWYRFYNDNTIILSFTSNKGYWTPSFNSKVEATIYTCNGESANFDEYDRQSGIPVQKSSDRYEYNASTKMVALCYSGSSGGMDKGDIETLRNDVILAHNTANDLSTDHDLQLWFESNADLYGTKSEFFKRRDDPTGRLFSQFVAITNNTYVYPTNTLSIRVEQSQFDFINSDADGVNNEFIIKPGHLWEYDDQGDTIVRDTVRMVMNGNTPAMITDTFNDLVSTSRPFVFTNPFYIKISRDPTISAQYNILVNDTSYPEDVPISTDCFYQFQLATLNIYRSISKTNSNKYKISVVCVPVITTDTSMKYIEGIGDDYPVYSNNLRLVLVTRSDADGETGYIEMTPTESRSTGSIVFETEIAVSDNINSDMMIQVDLDNTPGMKSLITSGDRKGEVYIDAEESSFHFICLIRYDNKTSTTTLFGDETYSGYIMANRFANRHRDLNLYNVMSMMRSTVTFEGENNNYTITSTLNPFLRYDIPLDESKMEYFIRKFNDQYNAMEPIISKLDGNSYLDFKLFNTYGRSSNYYIGPKDGEDVLWNSDILLDNVYVKIKLRLAVYDRSMYTQTVEAVINDIKSFFDSLNAGDSTDIHVSDLIHLIKENQPNVNYIRFLGFNDYDANKQSIFVKYSDISELKEDQLQCHVPEMIRVDTDSIEIIEEV